MCYIIESKQGFDFDTMTGSIEKRDMNMDFMKIWITANYDFFSLTHLPISDNVPFQFDASFGNFGNYIYRVRFRETIVKALNCKTSDTEYVSDQQCLVNMFNAEHFSPCPIKCVPIQMKGFHYVNKSTSLINCPKLEDEICNSGPKVWKKLNFEFPNCLNPCKRITYKDSQLDWYEPMYLKKLGQTIATFELVMNSRRKIIGEVLVYDIIDVIGATGGSLGLFLGFSFFDVISKCMDNLIMPFINYLVSLN
jgi:hypothetical protein